MTHAPIYAKTNIVKKLDSENPHWQASSEAPAGQLPVAQFELKYFGINATKNITSRTSFGLVIQSISFNAMKII